MAGTMIPHSDNDPDAANPQWDEIVTHLATAQVVVMPPEFRQGVMRRIAREQLRRDFVLAVQVGTGTAVILTGITASLLGWNWWTLPLRAVHSGLSATFYETVLTNVIYALRAGALLVAHTRAVWSWVPPALLAVAFCAAVAQFTLFQVWHRLHLGNSPGRLFRPHTS
ncbi:MAG TPA: hypothetical protein VFV83_01235 [Chthoniobacteraceae bacterium]|nr:hypothetical protein [Chthoniobacteraceae bacterium]